jgi:hypothetical protein
VNCAIFRESGSDRLSSGDCGGGGGNRGRRRSMVPQLPMDFSIFRRKVNNPSVKDTLAVVGLKKALLIGRKSLCLSPNLGPSTPGD